MLVRKAVFEFKAGQFGLGHKWADQAKSELEEPTPVLMMLAIESRRYGLARQYCQRFEQQWRSALRSKCRSQTAGRMCLVLAAYLAVGFDYRGRFAHVRHVLAYVRRCSRVKWKVEDLWHACGFVDLVLEQGKDDGFGSEELLEKLVSKGRKRFSDCAFFHYLAGRLEMREGPLYCDRRRARACFEQALEAAKGSSDPLDAKLAKEAKRCLLLLEEGPPASPFDTAGAYDEEYDEHDEYDGEEDEGPDDPLDVFARACASMGVDPEDVLDEAGREMPGGPRHHRRKSKAGAGKRR